MLSEKQKKIQDSLFQAIRDESLLEFCNILDSNKVSSEPEPFEVVDVLRVKSRITRSLI